MTGRRADLKMIRAVIDINVIISAVIIPRGFPSEIWTAWKKKQFDLVISDGMLIELTGKLSLPKISRYGITEVDISFIITLLRAQSELIPIRSKEIVIVTKDPEDDLVLATFKSNANYLVTGDKRLLGLKEYAGAKIVSPREFISILQKMGD